MYQSGFWQETDGSFKLGNSKFHKEAGKDYRINKGWRTAYTKPKLIVITIFFHHPLRIALTFCQNLSGTEFFI